MPEDREQRIKELESELFTYKDNHKNIIERSRQEQEQLKRRNRECRELGIRLDILLSEKEVLRKEVEDLQQSLTEAGDARELLYKQLSATKLQIKKLKSQQAAEPCKKKVKKARIIHQLEEVYL